MAPTKGTRKAFVSSLLREDLQKVALWHGSRPQHEQKRFLQSINALHCHAERDVPDEDQPSSGSSIKLAVVGSHCAKQSGGQLRSEARPHRGLRLSTSVPGMMATRHLDVAEELAGNSFVHWLDGRSASSPSSAGCDLETHRTLLSDATPTASSASSGCSFPGTAHQTHFRAHKRGWAANRRSWSATNQHRDGHLRGVPEEGVADCDRLRTMNHELLGSQHPGKNVHQNMYDGIFKEGKTDQVDRFVGSAPPEQREEFKRMVRSLQYLRLRDAKENISVGNQELDLQENSRLWKPPRQAPVFDKSERNASMVPLGAIFASKSQKLLLPETSDIAACAPPSPSVSGLGSLQLSRESTPRISTAGTSRPLRPNSAPLGSMHVPTQHGHSFVPSAKPNMQLDSGAVGAPDVRLRPPRASRPISAPLPARMNQQTVLCHVPCTDPHATETDAKSGQPAGSEEIAQALHESRSDPGIGMESGARPPSSRPAFAASSLSLARPRSAAIARRSAIVQPAACQALSTNKACKQTNSKLASMSNVPFPPSAVEKAEVAGAQLARAGTGQGASNNSQMPPSLTPTVADSNSEDCREIKAIETLPPKANAVGKPPRTNVVHVGGLSWIQ